MRFVKLILPLVLLCACLRLSAGGNNMWQRLTPSSFTKAGDGSYKIVVVLAQYSDVSFFYKKPAFEAMLASEGYSDYGATGSAREYLEHQLGAPVEFTISDIVTVSRERAWYGKRVDPAADEHPGTFIAEACQAAAASVDFSLFDADGDGLVDNVFVFFAGEDEAQTGGTHTEYMWSHSHNLLGSDYGKMLEVGKVKINNYACSSELYRKYSGSDFTPMMAPIGTFCHEYLHNFGLVDLYDTDYAKSGGFAAGVWDITALMASGNYNNNGNTPPNLTAPELEQLGVRQAVVMTPGDYALKAMGTEGARFYRLPHPDNADEYYLFEARSPKGWDEFIGIPDTVAVAMAVYHIDKRADIMSASETYGNVSSADRWTKYNEVNANPQYQCVDLIEADQRPDVNPTSEIKRDISGIFFPRIGATELGGNARIPLSFRDGKTSDLALRNIRVEGDQVLFNCYSLTSPIPVPPVNPPKDDDMLYIIVLAADDGTLELRASNDVGAEAKWYYDGVLIEDAKHFKPSASGSIRLELLWPDGSTDYVYKKHTVK